MNNITVYVGDNLLSEFNALSAQVAQLGMAVDQIDAQQGMIGGRVCNFDVAVSLAQIPGIKVQFEDYGNVLDLLA